MRSPGFVTDRHDHVAGTDKAAFSVDRNYRYGLTRRWALGPTACWVMLNPSTASAFKDDQTIKRVISFTQRIGCGGLVVVNLYALRSTKPDALWNHKDPVGPLCEEFLNSNATGRTLTIAAWGTHGARNGRGQHVADGLADAGISTYCLGTTANGQPKHPLYVRADTSLVPYRVGVGCDA